MYDKLRTMLKERKAWMILRGIEQTLEQRNAPNTVPREEFVSEVLIRNARAFPWMRFKDKLDVMRTFDSLVEEGLAYHKDINSNVKGLVTRPKGDGYFYWLRFLNKFIEEFGFWKVIAAIITILTFVPNGWASKLFDRLF